MQAYYALAGFPQRTGQIQTVVVNDNYSGRFAPITLAARGLV